jgi:hypothetical protein
MPPPVKEGSAQDAILRDKGVFICTGDAILRHKGRVYLPWRWDLAGQGIFKGRRLAIAS